MRKSVAARRLQTSLLVVGELRFGPFGRAGGRLLLTLLSTRHERRSTLVTVNLVSSA